MTNYGDHTSRAEKIVKVIVFLLEALRTQAESDPKLMSDQKVRAWYLARLDKLIAMFKSFKVKRADPFWMTA